MHVMIKMPLVAETLSNSVFHLLRVEYDDELTAADHTQVCPACVGRCLPQRRCTVGVNSITERTCPMCMYCTL